MVVCDENCFILFLIFFFLVKVGGDCSSHRCFQRF